VHARMGDAPRRRRSVVGEDRPCGRHGSHLRCSCHLVRRCAATVVHRPPVHCSLVLTISKFRYALNIGTDRPGDETSDTTGVNPRHRIGDTPLGCVAQVASDPDEGRGEADRGVVAAGGLVAPHRDATPVLELVEAAVDDVAPEVDLWVEGRWPAAGGSAPGPSPPGGTWSAAGRP